MKVHRVGYNLGQNVFSKSENLYLLTNGLQTSYSDCKKNNVGKLEKKERLTFLCCKTLSSSKGSRPDPSLIRPSKIKTTTLAPTTSSILISVVF